MNGGLLLMQVLKEDVLNMIKRAAVDCFMELGYEAASMREISRRASISVGNVYRYFPNKEALFDFAVEPALNLLKEGQKKQPISGIPFLDVNFMNERVIMDQIINLHTNYREGLFLLLLRNTGTKYENIKKLMIEIMVIEMNKFIELEFGKDQTIIQGSIYTKAAAGAVFEGICVILEESTDDYTFVYNMIQFLELNIKAIARHLYNIRDKKVQFRRISDEEINSYFSNTSNSGCFGDNSDPSSH